MDKKIDLEYRHYKFTPIGQRRCYAYVAYLFARQFAADRAEAPHFVGQAIDLKEGVAHIHWIYREGEFERYLEHYGNNLSFFRNEISWVEMQIPALFSEGRPFDARTYIECVERAFRLPTSLRGIDHALLPQLTSFLDDVQLGLLTQPAAPTAAEAEVQALRSLSAAHLSEEAEDQRLQSIYSQYRWLASGYYNEQPKDMAWYKNELRQLRQSGAHAQILNAKSIQPVQAGTYSEGQQKLIRLAQETAHLKDAAKLLINTLLCRFNARWEAHSATRKLGSGLISSVLPDEIISFFNGEHVNASQIASRNRLLLLGRPEGFRLLEGPAADEFQAQYLRENESSQLKGRVATRGWARGIAKVVVGQPDFSKLEDGDILIVSNTTPDYAPILKKAAAIVAEEGGITAHVSVISRELKVPCVVGVPHVTHTIQDGQIVEVDAHTGTIRVEQDQVGK